MDKFYLLLKQMQKGYAGSTLIHTSPFLWKGDPKTNQGPVKASAKLHCLMWSFNVFLVTLTAIFVGIRCIQTATDAAASTEAKVYMQFAFILYFYSFILQLSNFVCRDELAVFACRYIYFIRQSIVTSRANESWRVLAVCAKFLYLIRAWLLSLPLLGACLAMVNPMSAEMWSSLLDSPETLHWILRLPLVGLQAYLMMLLADVGLMFVSTTFPFLLFTTGFLKLLK